MQTENTITDGYTNGSASILPMRKPETLPDKENDMPPNPRLKQVEVAASNSDGKETTRFIIQIATFVIVILGMLVSVYWFSYNAGIERGIEKEKNRMMQVWQERMDTLSEREQRIEKDRSKDKADAYDESQKRNKK